MLSPHLENIKIILASKSPRRQQLLSELGIDFEVRLNSDDDELFPENLSMTEIPIYLAQHKAKPLIASLKEKEILVTSDTIVWCQDQVINKPTDPKDAYRILKILSNCKHIVITGVCLTSTKATKSFFDSTDVYFRELTDEEIWYYIDNFKPFDKAGAYGIQEWIGYIGIEKIDGSYFNVMGFPVHKFYAELLNFVKNYHT